LLRWAGLIILVLFATVSLGAAFRHESMVDYIVALAGLGAVALAHRISRALDAEARQPLGPGLRLLILWLTSLCGVLVLIAAPVSVAAFSEQVDSWPLEYVVVTTMAIALLAATAVGIAVLRGRLHAWAFAAVFPGSMLVLIYVLEHYDASPSAGDRIFWVLVYALLVTLTVRRPRPTRLTRAST